MTIHPGLLMGATGEQVLELHRALAVMGMHIEPEERDAGEFGASTCAAIIKLQALAGLGQTGVLDTNTKVVIDVALDRLGFRDGDGAGPTAAGPYSVQGRVTDADGEPLAGALVVALDCDLRARRVIARGQTDPAGEYRVSYTAQDLPEQKTAADLAVEVQDAQGAVLASSPIIFHAPRDATVDVALGDPAHAAPSEFASLSATIAPQLGKLTPLELLENDEHRDITFLSGETGVASERLAMWSVAHRMAVKTELAPELLYGLLRSGVPADAHVAVLAESAAGADLDANADRLLSAILNTSTTTVAAALEHAFDGNLIPLRVRERAKDDVARLAELSCAAALASTDGFSKTTLQDVLGAAGVADDQQLRFAKLYDAADRSPRGGFWRDLVKQEGFSQEVVDDLRFGMTVGRLTAGHAPLVSDLASQRRAGKITHARDLARLTADEWQNRLQVVGVPRLIAGDGAGVAIGRYAALLERAFGRAYPTSAFAARVAADDAPAFVAAKETARFLDANPGIDLRSTNIDAYVRHTDVAADVRQTLLDAQRLMKVNPDFSVMHALMTDGVHSAQQIYHMGRDRFVAKYAALDALGPTRAARTWARAEQTYAMSMALALKYNAMLDLATPAAANGPGEALKQDAVAAYPNLQTLFGSASFTACEECESVLGAAAYLVDILEFLAHRASTDGRTARDVLLSRRPDIADIELTCKNTNTELPFIDLVNELLENAVAPPDSIGADRMRQTTLSTPELDANPEYVNDRAYAVLAEAIYPWSLPFDLPLAEARAYLAQIGLDRSQLLRTFQEPEPPALSGQGSMLAREALGLSGLQADLITAGSLVEWYTESEHWGLADTANVIPDPLDPTKTVSGDFVDVLAQARVLLSRAGLTYAELSRLLNTIFINGTGKISLDAHPADSGDVATMTVTGLDVDALKRLRRFVRLWRRLDWDPYDLDDAIQHLQPATAVAPGLAQLNNVLLRQLAAVLGASTRLRVSVREAVSLFAQTMPTRAVPTLPGEPERTSLYHDLFENLTVLNPPDPIFALNADGSEIAQIASGPKLLDHAPALVAALEISQSDLVAATTGLTDGRLTLANLATLYRNAKLASSLDRPMRELITLQAIAEDITSWPPFFEPIAPFDATQPESLAAFLAVAEMIASTGLSVDQVDYIVRGVAADRGVEPDPVAVGTMLLAVSKGLAKIAADLADTPDPTGAATRKALAKLLRADEVAPLMTILDGTSTDPPAAQQALVAAALGTFLDTTAAQAHLVGAAALAAGQPRFEYVLHAVLAHQRRTLGTGLVVQTLAPILGLTSAMAALLLTDWFGATVVATGKLIDDFLALPEPVDRNRPVAPGDPGFAPYFAAYAALAKTALVISSLHFGTEDVQWWRSSGQQLGWLDPTKLPASPTAKADGRLSQLARLVRARAVRDRVPIVDATLPALFDLAAPPATKAGYLTELASITGWPADALAILCGDPADAAMRGLLNVAFPDDFLSETALWRLMPCFDLIARTGIPAGVPGWIDPDVASSTADAIKQSVKATYSELQWPAIAKDLRDELRMAQRDALVSYLLTRPPKGVTRWRDPDDVFAHFLIDVEMCSCMSTSRIVQATAAVQLFVQRCFLSLEPGVAVDVGADGSWLQWQWMSQYRVWEANRQVFLFPENWIDPTLRAGKSTFFAELEQDLKQGDLTNDVAETALQGYLEKLEAVARLDVLGTFHDIEGDTDVLHVLARTQGAPHTYYSRTWVNGATWTGWREVKLDIAGDHVLPVVWNGKTYIFWAIVTVKPDRNNQPAPPPTASSAPPPPPNMHIEVQLAWSQYKHGKWQAKRTAPQIVVEQMTDHSGRLDSSSVTLKSAFNGQLLDIDVYVYDPGLWWGSVRRHMGSFQLGGFGGGVEALMTNPHQLWAVGDQPGSDVGELPSAKPWLSGPSWTPFNGSWLAPSFARFVSTTRPRVSELFATYDLYNALTSERLLDSADKFRLVVPHQTPRFDSSLPFFYRDRSRQYFIVPTFYYRNGNYFTLDAPSYGYHPFFKAEYRFFAFYHAFVPLLVAQLNVGGVKALYRRELQLDPAGVQGTPAFDFNKYYAPTPYVMPPLPGEGIDFNPSAGYALYNWELFFHAPFLIGNLLATNQRFEDAKRWYEYIFNPAGGTTAPVPQRFWTTKPFFQATAANYYAQQIDRLMKDINDHDPVLEHQVATWRRDPFDPDTIAQLRPVAYQRAIVMKYIDNLVGWGDKLFRQNTRESINLATQLYVLADELLGPRPELVPPRVKPPAQTYRDLASSLDVFSNAAVAAENAIPPVSVNVPTPPASPPLPALNTLYFRIPPNMRLFDYWDTVADRLYKIRHCMNIEGVVQDLSLFAPPIDPGALVAASAAGLDLASVLSDSQAALPPYRFRVMVHYAIDLCEQVKSLGAGLLAALEKGDAEELAQLRAGSEKRLQAAVGDVRTRQIDAASQELEVLAHTKKSAKQRAAWYDGRAFMNAAEIAAMTLQGGALVAQTTAAVLDATATTAHALPKVVFGGSGAGGTPHVVAHFGGENVGHAATGGAWVARMVGAGLQTGAEMSATIGRYQQRQDEWRLQGSLAHEEIARIDAETVAAKIKIDLAQRELRSQEISIQQSADADEFLHDKFTNKELYDWMVGQASTTYFQAYQLAFSMAKQAERCFQRELAAPGSHAIQFGYWDSLRHGLTAGEKLHYDLQRLQSAYYTDNDRELEIVKHVSLLQIDPRALVDLRTTGSCLVNLPEILFDLDYPGHYLRRLKSVSVTMPCVVGPYTGVSMTLELLSSQIRTSSVMGTTAAYPRAANDARFVDDRAPVSAIVTSTANHDDGLFELRLDDDRYLPFEGSGAISNWRLTLSSVYPQFDHSTISDVVLHVRYTARSAGAGFAGVAADSAKEQLNGVALAESRKGLYRLFSARHDNATEWARFLSPAPGADQVLTIQTPPERFPFFTRGMGLQATAIDVVAKTANAASYDLVLTPPGAAAPLASIAQTGGVKHWSPSLSKVNLGRAPSPAAATPATWTMKVKKTADKDFRSLQASELEDLAVIVSYTVTP
jgi:hypothetical protein